MRLSCGSKLCHMPALVGGIIGALQGAAVGIALWMVWYFSGQLNWRIIWVAPFLGCVWGISGGFAAGAVPTEHRLGPRVHRLIVLIFAALGGGTGGFAFGLLIDRDRGMSTPMWTLIAAFTGAICGLMAAPPRTHELPKVQPVK